VAYDEQLAQRVRQALSRQDGIIEKKMFGGLAFMLHGNMSVGVEKDRLMVRVGPDRYEEALARPHARPMDFTGRPMKGFVYVPVEGVSTNAALQEWVQLGVDFALSLPRK
jgi:TfoX/Sxy family transcriptional regulator of competence genes